MYNKQDLANAEAARQNAYVTYTIETNKRKKNILWKEYLKLDKQFESIQFVVYCT